MMSKRRRTTTVLGRQVYVRWWQDAALGGLLVCGFWSWLWLALTWGPR